MLRGDLDGTEAVPRVFAWLFILVPGAMMLCGWALSICILIVGTRLAQHRAWMFCLVIAGIECILMPFGTVLGVFTLVVLMKDTVKDLFVGGQGIEPMP